MYSNGSIVAVVLTSMLLSGCSSSGTLFSYWSDDDAESSTEARESVADHEYASRPYSSKFEYTPDSRDSEHDTKHIEERGFKDPLHHGFHPPKTHKQLNDYASQLAMALMDNATRLTHQDKVGVTSFVRLNASLNESTVLGNQLSEYLIAELQDFGLAIIDFKLAGAINVTSVGDFVLTRNAHQLAQQVEMDHVVTGTIIEDARGVRVNARIVSLADKQVVASANVYIPAFIVMDLNKMANITP